MPGRHLVITDPQNDFCDLPEQFWPVMPDGARVSPALPVDGAHADMQRLAGLVERCGNALSDISVTLDTHHSFDIGHPAYWREPVSAFTRITAADVRAGRYLPRLDDALQRTLAYLDVLEKSGRYAHTVWPEHCLIGSWGHSIHADVYRACHRWEGRRHRATGLIIKGLNPWTEHYSAVIAEVPDENDPSTGLNVDFIRRLSESDAVYIAGEAGSHCVRATCEAIVAHIDRQNIGKLALITDCMSPVSGFESQQDEFFDRMRALGVALVTSEALIADWVS